MDLIHWEPPVPNLFQTLLARLYGNFRGPGKNPQKIHVASTDNRSLSVLIQIHNPVGAVKRSEKGNFQLSFFFFQDPEVWLFL